MAFQYGAWQAPQAATLDNLLQGFQFGRGLRDDNDARKSLAALVDSEYGRGVNQQQPKGLAELAGAGNMVNQSVQSAYGATDPKLAAMLPGYLNSIKQAESGGNPNAKNPNSSATGLYQFTEGTWADLAKNNPNLMLTPDGRADPAQQERAIRAFTQQNAASLSKAGIGVNPGSLYAAHFLGPGGAQQAYGLPDDTPMIAAVGAEVVQANPFLANMTVGQFKQWAAEKGGNARGGYQAPMMDQGQPMGAAAPANGLPPVEILKSLVQNPQTREIGLSYLQMGQQGQQKLTSDMQEYQLAQSQGYQGSFMDYMTSLKSAGATNVNVGQSEYGTIPQGFELFTDPATGARSMRAIAGGPAAIEAQKAADAAATKTSTQQTYGSVVTEDIDRAISIIKQKPLVTTGMGAQLTGGIGGLPANDVEKLLQTVKANAGFDRLQAMRDSSPTGGALGQVTERELAFLQSAIGSLEQSQSAEQLVANLGRVKKIYSQIVDGPNARQQGEGGWQDAGDGVRIRVKE
jgi:hypothetical protein